MSSELELWALMVLGGQKWSERLHVCDLSERAFLFRCMVVRLYWHFHNFPWLHKVFLQTFLHFVSQFRNLKAILKLRGDFAAISKLGDDFTAKWHFRRPFRSLKVISRLRNECMGLPNGTRVTKSGFAAAKHPSKWRLGCEIPTQLCTLFFKRP